MWAVPALPRAPEQASMRTMNRSMGSSGLRMVSTASTTMSVSWSASSSYSFVRSEVLRPGFGKTLRSACRP